mmetsp:Transcript_18642/g.46414  ORF Transcript_18642/g.46414 Transcript_18642/m.46414 type:complete len:246 (-) Transcript_18642:589-1326(-)
MAAVRTTCARIIQVASSAFFLRSTWRGCSTYIQKKWISTPEVTGTKVHAWKRAHTRLNPRGRLSSTAVLKNATAGVVSRSMSCRTFCGVAWCLLCIWFHMSPLVASPNPHVAAWMRLSIQMLPVRELWPPSCCTQPQRAPKNAPYTTEASAGQFIHISSVPSANVAPSSAKRYARCALLGLKNPSFCSCARHLAKSSSMGPSGPSARAVSAGRCGSAFSIFHALGLRKWNSLNASVASAPVLLSM